MKNKDLKMEKTVKKDSKVEETKVIKEPDEKSGISAEGHLRIFDPETDEEFLNGRDD